MKRISFEYLNDNYRKIFDEDTCGAIFTAAQTFYWGWTPFDGKLHFLFRKFGWCLKCTRSSICDRCRRALDKEFKN